MGTARKKVTQLLRCTASLTFFTARLGKVSVLRNISGGVKQVHPKGSIPTHKKLYTAM